jgi:hypothetical protein
MDIHELKSIAESLETALLERLANREIINYAAQITTDGEINVWYFLNRPIEHIKIDLKIAPKMK